ncbi:uncharacterized protein LOC111025324 [Momordica charantia]|uniref:Uncharacterized protein LOC111025324 n=1 Tax=Momordica charantia TaxID=3673 RepID=A0A6J1E271_MOMCH|nr:uncharacterized protein LOC111025324 [Momordica charantia]
MLSFAGHLQLICSVLQSFQVYWASVFVLPARVVHEVERLLRSFLWKGCEGGSSGAKVACINTQSAGCSPLGLVELCCYYEAALASSHACWVVVGRLGGGLCSTGFLYLDCPAFVSIFLVLAGYSGCPGFSPSFGDGRLCFVWHDPWLSGGPIHPRCGDRVIYDVASSSMAKVVDFLLPDGSWRWPRVSVDLLELLPEVMSVRTVVGKEDRFVWTPAVSGLFSVSSVWGILRPRRPPVSYFYLLWFGGNIPKHSFISWLAIRDRLFTRERLRQWNALVPATCVFCAGLESRDHLFLDCPYSRAVWAGMISWAGSSHRVSYWSTELTWICHVNVGSSSRRHVWRLAWTLTVSLLWREPNLRIHRGQGRSSSVLLRVIKAEVATFDGFVKERMNELVDLWKGLDLSDEKNEVVQVGYESNLLSADSVELCAVAKVLLTRRISADAFRLVMKSLWRFDKSLVILVSSNAADRPSDLQFTTVSFWVKIHNVPFQYMTREVAVQLDSVLGFVEGFDCGDRLN